MTIRLGILNVFWFGSKPADDTLKVGFYHEPADDVRVRNLIDAMKVDLLVLVEIVDVARIEQNLKLLPGTWRLRDAQGAATCSRPPGSVSDDRQRVVIARNEATLELLHWGMPIDSKPRRPVVARFRERASSKEFTVVGVHPKSGLPRDWNKTPVDSSDNIAGQSRTVFFDALSSWLKNPAAGFAGSTVLMGDFNSVRDSPETAPLRDLPNWKWPVPSFVPSNADRRTTRTDPEIIDHFVVSPGLTFGRNEVLAFDLLPEFPHVQPESSLVWKRTTDHRGVILELDL